MERGAQEFLKFATHQLGIRSVEDFRGSAVYRAQGSIEGDRERHVVERINQFLEVALRTHDQLA